MKFTIDTGDKTLKEVIERLFLSAESDYFEGTLNRLAVQTKRDVKAIQHYVDNKILALGYLSDNEKYREERASMLRLADKLAKIRSLVEDFIDDIPKPKTKGETQ